jgi:branched-chain amino acid transport system ATP-binding protein
MNASTQSAPPKLQLQGYSSGYGGKLILNDVAVDVCSGESVALLGPNGAGKTTFLTSIVGGTRVFAGTVFLDGSDVTRLSRDRFVNRGVAIVPQTGGVFADLTVRDNLRLARLASRRDLDGEVEAEVLRTSILGEMLDRKALTLSGGERQMLAIARALCCRPDLLLLDEPSLGLAPKAIAELVRTVRWAKERYGLTVILAEQHLQEAIALCSRFYLLKSGRIIRSGAVDAQLGDILRAEYLM